MIRDTKIGVVILAAGASRRLGFPKQLVDFRNKPLLQNAIDLASLLEFDCKILVLGANEEKIKQNIDQKDFEVVDNKQWEEGMASSIRTGIKNAISSQPDLEHLMILLSDQPLVSKAQLERLIETQINKKSIATFSEYNGNTGVPAIFSKALFSDLIKLEGDQGAKKLMQQKDFEYETVKFEAANFDVDTREDVEILKDME